MKSIKSMTKVELYDLIEKKSEELKDLKQSVKNLERYKQYEYMADEFKAMHSAFVNSGFSDEQALEMLKLIIKSFIPKLY